MNAAIASIGARVRDVRHEIGLRQDELAGAAGVGPRFIGELEAGKPTLRLDKVLQVLAALGLTLAVEDVRQTAISQELDIDDDPDPAA